MVLEDLIQYLHRFYVWTVICEIFRNIYTIIIISESFIVEMDEDCMMVVMVRSGFQCFDSTLCWILWWCRVPDDRTLEPV